MAEYSEDDYQNSRSYNKILFSKKLQPEMKGKSVVHYKPTKPLNSAAVKRLADDLETNTTTLSVILDSCSMGSNGFIHLAKALETNSTLETLQLSDSFNLEHAQESLLIMEADINKIEKDHGAVSIARVLECKNTTLTRLCLASNNLGPRTFEAFARTLYTNRTLEILDLSDNKKLVQDASSTKAIKLLAVSLRINTTLTCLRMQDNELEKEGLLALLETLEYNRTLKELDVCSSLSKWLKKDSRVKFPLSEKDIAFTIENNKRIKTLGTKVSLPQVIITALDANRRHKKSSGSPSSPYLSEKPVLNVERRNSQEVPSELICSDLGQLQRLQPNFSADTIFSNLRMISIKGCGLTFAPTLRNSSSLLSLDLSGNNISSLPPNYFEDAYRITFLNLQRNKFRELPAAIGTLSTLSVLNMCSNLLSVLDTSKLPTLSYVLVRNNCLTTLSPDIEKLSKLETLDISFNSLEYLPVEFHNLISEGKIVYNDNPLTTIPSQIRNAGDPAVCSYLRELESGSKSYSVVKLMFFGQAGVGKTTTIRRLTSDKKLKGIIATDGIDISEWKQEGVTFRTWDFAGQLIYYNTHQLFVNSDAIYVIVFNLLHGEITSKVEYWLNSITAYAHDAHVLIVGTFAEKKVCSKREYIQNTFNQMRKRYAEYYPSCTIDFVAISNKERKHKGFKDLKNKVLEYARKCKLIELTIPCTYYQLIEMMKLEKEKLSVTSQPPILSWERFKALATELNISNIKEAAFFLNRIGEIAYFGHDSKLSEKVFLCPQWLVDVFSSVITLTHTFIKNGKLSENDLIHIWKSSDYPETIHKDLLQLLQQFDIIYQLPDKTWLVPCLLSGGNAKEWPKYVDFEDNARQMSQITRSFRFKFLPHGFFARVTVRTHHLPNLDITSWENGFILHQHSSLNKALVEFDPAIHTLKIQVRGDAPAKLALTLFDLVRSLVQGWFKKVIDCEEIWCVHCLKQHDRNPQCFKLRELELIASTGKQYALCRGVYPVRIDQLAPDVGLEDVPRVEPGHIILEEHLGAGGYDSVYAARVDGQRVAVKVVQLKLSQEDLLPARFQEEYAADTFARYTKEVLIISGLHHPNIVELKAVSQTDTELYMISELMEGGNLGNYLASDKPLGISFMLKIAYDIAMGMQFLHSVDPPILHRDLKSANVLLTGSESGIVAKVADFGLSVRHIVSVNTPGAANPAWCAPEVLDFKPYTLKADVYSYGIVLWELISREVPYAEFPFIDDIMNLTEAIVKFGTRPTIPQDCPRYFRLLVTECWAQEQDRRPDFVDIIERLDEIKESQGYCSDNVTDDYSNERPFSSGSTSFSSNCSTSSVDGHFIINDDDGDKCLNECNAKLQIHNQLGEGHSSINEIDSIPDTARSRNSRNSSRSSLYSDNQLDLDSLALFKIPNETEAVVRKMITVNNSVWTAWSDGNILIWNGETGKLRGTIPADVHRSGDISTLVFSEGSVLSGSAKGVLCIWSTKGELMARKKLKKEIVSLTDTGTSIWCGLANGKIQIRSKSKSLKKTKNLKMPESGIPVKMIYISQLNVVAVACQTSIYIFHPLTAQVTLKLQGYKDVSDMEFIHDIIWSCSANNKTIRLWDVRKYEYCQKQTLSGLAKPILCAIDKYVCGISTEHSLLALWNHNSFVWNCCVTYDINIKSPNLLVGVGNYIWTVQQQSIVVYNFASVITRANDAQQSIKT